LNNGTSQQNTFQSLTLTADALTGGNQRIDVRGATTTTASGTLNLGGFTLTTSNTNQFSIVGAAVTDGNIVATPAGTTGTLSIESGTNIPDLGTGKTITYNAPAGGTLTAAFFQNVGTVTRPMVFNTGSGTMLMGNNSNTAATIGSNMTLNGDIAISPRNATGTGQLTLTGVISGTGAINKTADNGGNNTLVLAGNNTYAGATTIAAGTIQLGGGTTSGTLGPAAVTNNANLAFNRTDTLTVANAISGTGAVHQKGTGTTVLSGVNTYTGATNVTAGHLVIGNGDAIGSGTSLLNIGSLGTAHIGASLPKAVKVNGLTNANVLDVNNGKLVVDYTGASPLDTIRTQVIGGYAGGSWNGVGINTSAPLTVNGSHAVGVGYAEASTVGAANSTWNGQAVDGDAVLVRYTLAGDGNVDGKVDLTDFTFLASNFNKSGGAKWLEGDFNYDGNVNLTDFTFLASNFNQSMPADGGGGGAGASSSLGGLVPEPASLSAVVLLMGGLLGRRSRRRAR